LSHSISRERQILLFSLQSTRQGNIFVSEGKKRRLADTVYIRMMSSLYIVLYTNK